MKITDTSDLWWKSAIIYCLDVGKYLDWSGDGTGDFEGLSQRIDYLADLGVTCLWLMPFYPTPNRDDGYDITDFYGVDPRLGSFGDFVEFIRTAKDRGMRVIVDLVINHTSDRHPWFRAARSSRDNPYRDFYVWRDEPPAKPQPVSFPGEEASSWELDKKTGQYYLHSFYTHQPDLNHANPRVRDEIAKLLGFWLEFGISGFRVDAVPFILELPSSFGDPHKLLRDLRRFLGRRSSEAILLGEVNLPYEDQLKCFGGELGDELSMQFDFIGMQRMYLSLARGSAAPLIEALKARPKIAPESQWANFLRNHDELTLDKLNDKERAEVFAAFAPDESQRIYDRGITRRLPTMLEGDPRRIRMAYSLMFSLPGTPVLFYGEEIGMGENPDIEGRMSVRTPMQWAPGRTGGFSSAPPSRLVSKPPSGGWGPEHVNVVEQRHDQDSLMRFISRLIVRHRTSPEIGWGDLDILECDADEVLAHSLTAPIGRMVAIHNFAPEALEVNIKVPDEPEGTILSDLMAPGEQPIGPGGRTTLELNAYGHRWLRVVRPGDKRLT